MAYGYLDGENPRLFFDILNKRKQANKNSIIVITGEVRSGKSFSAIKIAETIDPSFKVDEGLFFKPSDFMKYFKTAYDKVIIYDEGSESFDRRTWYDLANKFMNSLVTRTGFHRNILIVTLPLISDLDTRIVRKLHYHLIPLGYDLSKQYSLLKVYRIKTIFEMGKSYLQGFPQLLKLSIASNKNLEVYQKMKVEWNDAIDLENIDVFDALENPETYQRKLSHKEYIEMFKAGKMPEIEFKKQLEKLNYSENDINYIVDFISSKNEEKDKEIPQDIAPKLNWKIKFDINTGHISYIPYYS